MTYYCYAPSPLATFEVRDWTTPPGFVAFTFYCIW